MKIIKAITLVTIMACMFMIGRTTKKETHNLALAIDSLPESYYKANLLVCRGSEACYSSEELSALLVGYARMKRDLLIEKNVITVQPK